MRNLSWIILFPLAVVLIVFAVSNRNAVSVDLWPFPVSLEVPLFALLFAALLIGVFWGGVATWLSGGSTRKAARSNAREAKRAESESRHLKDQISKLEADVRAGEERMASIQSSAALTPPKETPGLPPPAN